LAGEDSQHVSLHKLAVSKQESNFDEEYGGKKYFAGQNFSQGCPSIALGHLKPGIRSNLRAKEILLVEFFIKASRTFYRIFIRATGSNLCATKISLV
jgi:hypothetical protein